jgi:hypothetical protein
MAVVESRRNDGPSRGPKERRFETAVLIGRRLKIAAP